MRSPFKIYAHVEPIIGPLLQ